MAGGQSERVTAALLKIKGMNIDIASDKVRVCALLSDMEPELVRERRRIRALYETGAMRSVAAAVKAQSGAEMYLARAVQQLAENADMTSAAAVETVNYFVPLWYGLPKLHSENVRTETESTAAQLPDTDDIHTRPQCGFANAVSAAGAVQLSDEICRRYASWMESGTKDYARAGRLAWRAMVMTMVRPARAAMLWRQSVRLGGVEQMNLCGRQILAWHKKLGLEPALGFACVYTSVAQGASKGSFALGYCFHNGAGICCCPELAEKYYRLAAVEPSAKDAVERYLAALGAGKQYNDGEWRFF